MNYFQPLRRKLSVAMLLVACVFWGAWLTSMRQDDYLYLCPSRSNHIVVNCGGVVTWMVCSYPTHAQAIARTDMIFNPPNKKLWLGWIATKRFGGPRIVYWDSATQSSCYQFGDFAIVVASLRKNEHVISVSMPHWSIVLPLTLISTWFLFSKPRQVSRPQSPISEPEFQ